ncbi:MAG: MBL fold metallo-hydrolase [Clostridia bacterium]|nr:MBL fold metallo-hydrolase [Clostridia bacterium]
MDNWFSVKQLSEDTFVLSERQHWEETNCYLLLGEDRALLIDTGLGVGDLRAQVERLTQLPIFAVCTHVHWDHIGGHGQFDRHGVHPAEQNWLQGNFPLPLDFVKQQLMHDFTPPKTFDIQEYRVFQGVPDRLLQDGDVIDLGGRQILALHTPGHSPGHLCFWESRRGILYSGDLIYEGTLYANYPSTDPLAYLCSLETITKLPIQTILPGHHRLPLAPQLATEIRDGLRTLRSEGLLRHGSGLQAFESWSILL